MATTVLRFRVSSVFYRPSLPARQNALFRRRLSEHLRSGKLYDIGHFILVDKSRKSLQAFFCSTRFQYSAPSSSPSSLSPSKDPRTDAGRWLLAHGHRGILKAASAVDPHTHRFRRLHLVRTPVPDIDLLVDSLKNKWSWIESLPATAPANQRFCVCKKPSATITFTPEQARSSNTLEKSRRPRS